MRIPIRIGDVLVYLLVFLLTAFSFAGLYQMGRNTVTSQVVVEIDGVVWGTYDLPLEGEERKSWWMPVKPGLIYLFYPIQACI